MGLKVIKQMLEFDQASAWSDEVADRQWLVGRLLFTKIPPIDKAFKGIWPNDFVVVAAKSGSGKTEMVTQIALNIARQHKYVDLFALEASKYEIQRRIKFKLLSAYYYEATGKTDISYSGWMRFQLNDKLDQYAERLEADLVLLKKYLRIHYRTTSFDLKDFLKMYNYLAKDSELILCDHAQFFDFDDSKNENQHVKDMTLAIYDNIQAAKVPVVLVSHLRKLQDPDAIPDMADIYGSSELVKKATRVLLLSRGDYNEKFGCFETIFRIDKNREEAPTVMTTQFNIGLKQYSDKFKGGYIKRGQFVPYSEET
jgi:replicative DNA helicase